MIVSEPLLAIAGYCTLALLYGIGATDNKHFAIGQSNKRLILIRYTPQFALKTVIMEA